MITSDNASSRLLLGTRAVANFLGITPRQLLHLIETNRIPTFRIGRQVCAKPGTLEKWLNEQESGHEHAGNSSQRTASDL